MVRLTKQFWLGVLSCYLVWALLSGLAMRSAIPSLNALGVAYVGLTAPIPLTCSAFHVKCSVVPPAKYARWLFTFKPASRAAIGGEK